MFMVGELNVLVPLCFRYSILLYIFCLFVCCMCFGVIILLLDWLGCLWSSVLKNIWLNLVKFV